MARVLGSIYALESRFNDAEASFLLARDIRRRISDTVGEARTSASLGLLYNAQARCDEALECFKFAYNIFSFWDMEHEIADTFMGLGEVFRLRGMHNNAERIFKKALEIYIGMDDDAGKTAALCEIDNETLCHDVYSSRDTVASDDIWEFSSDEDWDATSPRNDLEGGSERPGDSATIKELIEPVDRGAENDLEALVAPIASMPFSVNGHFGDVFEGTHRTLGRVALKRPRISGKGYDDDVIRRFEREAATWRRLRHRHILEFIGTMKRDGHVYILCETADAVNYLHTEAVVHGDIKAGNILISNEGSALLCDFGLTRMMDAKTSTCMKGAGSVRWMSPELWDTASRSFESDVYAFGMTIAEVLSGKEPFPHLSNTMAVMRAVMMEDERPLREPTSSLDGLPYECAWDVAEACWPAKPSDRIPMAEAFQRLCTMGGTSPHGPILFCENH
ncbi:hypothetical protein FS837_007427 [Tulasnella sp. UAMH 9824]|nr:hypothetical protein FS837_007427 [Tulasnella sp. UAMH 9824]